MTIIQVVALLISLTALFSYLNYRFIKLPTTIGVMLIALLFSLALVGMKHLGFPIHTFTAQVLGQIDFDATLLQGMLSFLLFAGALQINLNDLHSQRGTIISLSLVGVMISTAVVGAGMYYVLGWVGLPLSFTWCLLFGALISPTDPIAVIGILKSVNVPKSLETKIAGESLFNDGIGVVVFIVLHEILVCGQQPSAGHIVLIFLEEAVGGALIGLALGWVTYRMLKSVDNYQVEVLLTLALVMGGYALASALHTSGPIAIVCAGLLIGNHGRSFAMSDRTRHHLDTFWELVDEILNALLFVLIGLEVLVLTFTQSFLAGGLIAIPLVLLARLISVSGPVAVLKRWRKFTPGAVRIMTWGGLRGGISVALALSLPPSREREIILAVTYIIVVFSIIFQGLTLKPLVKRLMVK
jgi:monovalent cation:H+ antiporter, CPA1 family